MSDVVMLRTLFDLGSVSKCFSRSEQIMHAKTRFLSSRLLFTALPSNFAHAMRSPKASQW